MVPSQFLWRIFVAKKTIYGIISLEEVQLDLFILIIVSFILDFKQKTILIIFI